LISVAPDGTNRTVVLTLTDMEGLPPLLPRCSPDGDEVVFFLRQEGKSSIFKTSVRTGDTVDLTPGLNAVDPAWSPDGGKIVFSATASGRPSTELWIMNADGSGAKPLALDGIVGLVPSWSPDGRQIAYASLNETRPGDMFDIWVAGVDNPERRGLVTGPSNDRQPVWSPDGQRLAFTRVGEASDSRGQLGLGGQIFVADASGENSRPVTSGPQLKFLPRWSPDGKQIVLSVAPDPGEALGERDERFQISVVNADGSEQREITNEPNGAHFGTWCR
jgi:Tol biopolymer transport system component